MKALSVLQPWSDAILRLGKSIENRTWKTSYRGPLLIHAGKSSRALDEWTPTNWREAFHCEMSPREEVTFGALLGIVDLVDIVEDRLIKPEDQGFRWIEGPFCWMLANPRVFEKPIPFRGMMGLFDVPEEVVAEAIVRWRPRL